jgi:TetR/AcrR family transcriptional regulator
MSEPGSRRGRAHDAEGTREAILNAAEENFATHGFDGARVDAIAATAGYNKSLIFHYYGDKLGLYTAVLKRIDEQANVFAARLIAPLLADEGLTSDAHKFRTFLATMIRMFFDFFSNYPHILRMFAWEAAEGWQTMGKILSELNRDDEDMLKQLLSKAKESGLIRVGIDTDVVLNLFVSISPLYLNFVPRLTKDFNGEDLLSQELMEHVRETIVTFVIHGIMPDSV